MKYKNIKKLKQRMHARILEDFVHIVEDQILQYRTIDYTKEDIIQELFEIIEEFKNKEHIK